MGIRVGLTVVWIVALVTGCGEKSVHVSRYPMLPTDYGEGPWQLVTYAGDKIMHETVALDGRQVVVRSESVYINRDSQLVYRDNTPIENYDGEYLYWNRDGFVINRHLQVVPEDRVFVVAGRPMQPRTPMKLRDKHPPSSLVSYTPH